MLRASVDIDLKEQHNQTKDMSNSSFEYHGPQCVHRFGGMLLDMLFDFVLERDLVPVIVECDNSVSFPIN